MIENALKTSPFVSKAVVVGDNRPYIVALITVDADEVKAVGRSRLAEVHAAIERVVER